MRILPAWPSCTSPFGSRLQATLGETRATRHRTDVDDPNCQGIVPFCQAWCCGLPTVVLWRAAEDEGPAIGGDRDENCGVFGCRRTWPGLGRVGRGVGRDGAGRAFRLPG